jgi:hypothetical protein
MFGLKPKLPITDDERDWVDEGFRRLSQMLGSNRMLDAQVILPTDKFFPDPFTPTEAGLEAIFRRVCAYMGVERSEVELSIIPDNSALAEMLPEFSHRSDGPAGLHYGRSDEELPLIAVSLSNLKDPLALVATLAHELGHVLLLDGGHLARDAEDMEPLTDLVTVYLGLGIFTANTARRFRQFQNDTRQGWSMSRLGYLSEEVYAYALARFAKDRGEDQPAWTVHLSTNLKVWFRKSAAWLNSNFQPTQ